ncbi:MAG: cysteine--tRNA ligase [Chlamydiae bacterium]|nr:MAG: cysteine--tRNA ligase [Chlamydiota bacterium]
MFFNNTLTRKKEEFVSLNDRQVFMYTCGPTVYNFAHIGNFRANVTYDLVKRWLKFRGYTVKHVMNITDVDDKTIRDSIAAGISLKELTDKYTAAFMSDCKKLRIIAPDIHPRATENIFQMIRLVCELIEKGFAYKAADNCVYFSISKFKDYGKLSHLNMKELRQCDRVTNDEYDKENVSDFALWKAWTENDGDVKWDSPWGPGRPGWHLECSVMAREFLADTIDIHMGGEDLIFPHHENEIAQSEAATGKPFVKYWLHNAYLLVEGKKMSKSLGNFFTARDIIKKGWTGREIRYVLLSTHYRRQLNFTFDGLHAARSALQRLDALREKLDGTNIDGKASAEVIEAVKLAREKWIIALDDDLDISAALALLFDFVREANRFIESGKINKSSSKTILSFLDDVDEILDIKKSAEEIPEGIIKLAEERTTARKEKNWARADEIRNILKDKGYTIEDTPDGSRAKKL